MTGLRPGHPRAGSAVDPRKPRTEALRSGLFRRGVVADSASSAASGSEGGAAVQSGVQAPRGEAEPPAGRGGPGRGTGAGHPPVHAVAVVGSGTGGPAASTDLGGVTPRSCVSASFHSDRSSEYAGLAFRAVAGKIGLRRCEDEWRAAPVMPRVLSPWRLSLALIAVLGAVLRILHGSGCSMGLDASWVWMIHGSASSRGRVVMGLRPRPTSTFRSRGS
jgi:hypothetical protein